MRLTSHQTSYPRLRLGSYVNFSMVAAYWGFLVICPLLRALTLRFGVLLTPAFWTTPIKRDLILADDGPVAAAREEAEAADATVGKSWQPPSYSSRDVL